MRCKLLLAGAIAALVALAVSASASAVSTKPRVCKRQNGFATMIAYNMACSTAKRYFRNVPAGWSGVNGDVVIGHGQANGIALLFRERDASVVLESRGRYERPDIQQLKGLPAVWAAVPYGE